MSEGQESLRGRVAALAVDFGTRARNMVASVESLLGSGHEFDAAELGAVSKAWADASAALWSLVGSALKHDTDRALVRIGLNDLAGLLTREEQLTRRTAELEAKYSTLVSTEVKCPHCGSIAAVSQHQAYAFKCTDVRCRLLFGDGPLVPKTQGAPSLYIAGGSSERLTVCRPWIARVQDAGARVTYDWTYAPNYDAVDPAHTLLRQDADRDIAAVLSADILWVLAPEFPSEGASTELGAALGARMEGLWNGRIVVSGKHARRNLFAHLADDIFDAHEQAWDAIRPRVSPGVST